MEQQTTIHTIEVTKGNDKRSHKTQPVKIIDFNKYFVCDKIIKQHCLLMYHFKLIKEYVIKDFNTLYSTLYSRLYSMVFWTH